MGPILAVVLLILVLFFGKCITLLFPSLIYHGKDVYLPNVTFKARLINLALFPFALIGYLPAFSQYTLQDLKKLAIKKTNLTNFGPSTQMESSYDFVLKLIHASNFSYLGKFIAHDYLSKRLIARLRTIDLLEKKPEILDIPVKEPFFILGLPRTGSTFLYRMLATDPNSRFPKTWEFNDPVPRYPNDLAKDAKLRSKYVATAIDTILQIVPQLQYQHELGADEPEECLLSLGLEAPIVPSTLFLLTTAHEVYQWDLLPAYQLHKKVLQILTHYTLTDFKHWVLKCPAHLGFVPEIEAVFPDSRIIWTHRDPKESIPSLISLMRTFMEMHWDGPIDLIKFGREMFAYWCVMLQKADQALQVSKCKLYHVKYKELIADPQNTVRKIYENFGIPYTEEHNKRLLEYVQLKNDERNKAKNGAPLHSYTLGEFGLTPEVVDEKLGWYIKKYL